MPKGSGGEAGRGPAVTSQLAPTDPTSALSSPQPEGGPADGWPLISSRQTSYRKHLPITFTETSSSPETGWWPQRERGERRRKTIGFSPFFCAENEQTVSSLLNRIWFNGLLPNSYFEQYICGELDCLWNHCPSLALGKSNSLASHCALWKTKCNK